MTETLSLKVDYDDLIAKMEASLRSIDREIAELQHTRGQLALSAISDGSENEIIPEVVSRIADLNERRESTGQALIAARAHRDLAEEDSRRATRLQRELEVKDLADALLVAARRFDKAAAAASSHANDVVRLRRALLDYVDVHGMSNSQIDPDHSINSAMSATGRLFIDRLDLRPVSFDTMAEQVGNAWQTYLSHKRVTDV